MFDQNRIKNFRKKILDWYKKNKRELPWRKTRDPYKILVSEIMLQQTQVSRVMPKYNEWLQRFPNINALAKAKTADVLRLWSGLGYNRRALYLKKIAEIISSGQSPVFPSSIEELQRLPGVGEYTARAIACFAFDQQVAVVDTNIRKVILTLFAKSHIAYRLSQKEIQEIADQLLPIGRAYDWNHALMDYSAEVLKKHKIPIVKQSKFAGSNRYYRGQIVKLLLARQTINTSELALLLRKDKNELAIIINGLIKDGLIKGDVDDITLV